MFCSVHAGWRGAASGIIENSSALFRQHQVAIEDVVVVCGPHIHACCYEVSAEFLSVAVDHAGGQAGKNGTMTSCFISASPRQKPGKRRRSGNDNLWFDLRALAQRVLQQAGVAAEKYRMAGKLYLLHAAGARLVPSAHPFFRRRKTFQYSWIMRE